MTIDNVLFLGSKQIGLRCLVALEKHCGKKPVAVITIDDRTDTRSVYSDILAYCAEHQIPLEVAENKADSERMIIEKKPDICLVVGWYWLIGNETIASGPYKLLGIHNSLLPAYRGGSPLNWALINGEPRVGISLFTLTDLMDAGDIWAQHSIEVNQNDSIGMVLGLLEDAAEEMIGRHFRHILDGSLSPEPQDHSKATYCAQRIPGDGCIRWNRSARQIHDFIRAQSKPYPGAYTCFEGKKLIVWEAIPDDRVYYGTPGQIARITSDGIWIICGDQKALIIKMVSFKGIGHTASQIIRSTKYRLTEKIFP